MDEAFEEMWDEIANQAAREAAHERKAWSETVEDETNAALYENFCAAQYEKAQAVCASCEYIGHDKMGADRKIAGRWYCFVHAMDIYCD